MTIQASTKQLSFDWPRLTRPPSREIKQMTNGQGKTGAQQRPRRLIVGISGASGAVYGIRILQILRSSDIETHLVMTKAGELALAYETDFKSEDIRQMADHCHAISDIGANISSGSFKTLGMIVAPCSIRSLSEIATGVTGNLLSRAADVVLKERRRLVLMVRETPLHAGHLKAMSAVTESGGIIAPPVPAFYTRPESLDDMVNQTVGHMLDLFDLGDELENSGFRRWGEDINPRS